MTKESALITTVASLFVLSLFQGSRVTVRTRLAATAIVAAGLCAIAWLHS